ncbi:hypothetical protein [Moraxella canis]|uniref:hypothetical protein n=1 Tax=Moraxella canis TaxID=90239 RepID=UPI00178CF9C5|nr:hypothetical protein [Moraxella canis]
MPWASVITKPSNICRMMAELVVSWLFWGSSVAGSAPLAMMLMAAMGSYKR